MYEKHRILLQDQGTQDRYRRAIRESVKPGDTVLDLGTGTGIHAFFASQAGAGKVYAIEVDDVIHLAHKLARHNGYSEKIDFLQGLSSKIKLPRKVDVIVTCQGLLELLEFLPDARKRFLKPKGRILPYQAQLFFAPLNCARGFREGPGFWKESRYGIDFTPVSSYAVNDLSYPKFSPRHYLAKPRGLTPIDFREDLPRSFKWGFQFHVQRPGIFYGLGQWFVYHLSKNVKLSTAPPLQVGSPPWDTAFFPIEKPIQVRKNDRIDTVIHMLPHPQQLLWTWKISVRRKKNHRWETLRSYSHSRFQGWLVQKPSLAQKKRQLISKRKINATPVLVGNHAG